MKRKVYHTTPACGATVNILLSDPFTSIFDRTNFSTPSTTPSAAFIPIAVLKKF